MVELQLIVENLPISSKIQWENTRFLTYNIISPYLKQSYRNKKMNDLIPLASDNYNPYKIEKEIIIDEEKVELDKEKIKEFEDFIRNNKFESSKIDLMSRFKG